MRREVQWQSAAPVAYGQATGRAILRYVTDTSRFEYNLPSASRPAVFDAASFDEVHRLKDRLEATLGSAGDIRNSLAFVDRYAAPRH